ncbi:MAG: hypothetical protein JO257_33310 [Deltaproteobacteria bacterium]|nr:hypothetical protein [Deltaproteobacteria bacterium]
MARKVLSGRVIMRTRLLVLPLLAVLGASAPAWALKPGAHRDLAQKACAANRLPAPFCERMGKQVYETDYLEWTDLSAHAQREYGQDRCDAAEAAATRVEMLARAMVDHAAAERYDDAAVDLGRALHTLQDECAHHGMTNEEHAFYSIEDTCGEGNLSPDTQLDALACAKARTDRIMTAAAAALRGTSWAGIEELCEFPNGCTLASLPSPFQACDFLARHYEWDGVDSRWNGDIVGPALEDAFARGLRGDPVSVAMCDAPDAIDPVTSRATVSDLEAGCLVTDVLCLGKADEQPAVATPPPSTAGCAAGGSPSLLVALLALRRRKQKKS